MGGTARKAARDSRPAHRSAWSVGDYVSVPGSKTPENRQNGHVAAVTYRRVVVRMAHEGMREVDEAQIGAAVEVKRFFRKVDPLAPVSQEALRAAQMWHGPAWSNGG